MRKFLFALSTLVGTTVGAGIFGIPYTIARSGLAVGLFYFFILGGAVLLIHLLLGEIVLRTKEKHRLIGYSRKYLGNLSRFLITISTIVGIVGTLLAYIIIGGDFLKIIFSPFSNFTSFYFSLFFGISLSYFIFRGIKLIAQAELLMNVVFFVIIFFILFFTLPKINLQNFTLINPSHLFLPYGVILFAFAASAAIPEIREILSFRAESQKVAGEDNEGKKYKKIIILSSAIVFILYLLFSLVVVGVSGKNTSEEAFSGLIPFLGQKIIVLGSLLGIITIAASFLVLGNYLKNSLFYDYRFPRLWAAAITCGLPLILFLIGFRSFIETIGFVGTLTGAVEGIIIVLIYKKAKKLGDRQPEYRLKIPQVLLYCLIAVFLLGAVFQIYYYGIQ